MSLTSAEGETLLGTTPIGAVVAALALFVSTSPDRGLGPPFQGGNKPAYMALSIRLVAPNSTRSALHDGIKNDSARDKGVKFIFFKNLLVVKIHHRISLIIQFFGTNFRV